MVIVILIYALFGLNWEKDHPVAKVSAIALLSGFFFLILTKLD